MKKFSKILENKKHEFDVLAEYIGEHIKLPNSDMFNFILERDNVEVDYDSLDGNLIMVEVFLSEDQYAYDDDHFNTTLKHLSFINDQIKKLFNDYLVYNSMHPDENRYKLIYHIKVKEFYNDPKWKSLAAIKKYDL